MDIHSPTESVISIELIARIKRQYRLNWNGIHGIKHWHRVYQNGMKLAQQEGVNLKVVKLFSVFHDACRRNENTDKEHGKRGAELASEMRKIIPLEDGEFQLLITACELHTSARIRENITIQCCMDADRLDLGRVGIVPDAGYLCSPLAKMPETIEWAYKNSIQQNDLPEHPFDYHFNKEE